jgi:acyl-CoA hydrolase
MLRAMRSVVPRERAARSIHVAFVGPVTPEENLRAEVELTRAGKALSHASARLVRAGEVRAVAFASFGAARASKITVDGPAMPSVVGPDEALLLPYVEGVTPTFTQHFALRWATGSPPFAGATEARFSGYAALREPSGPADEEVILALVDAWPAPVLSLLDRPAAASSVTWAVDFLGDASAHDAREPFFFRAETDGARDGYASVRGLLHAPDGRAVARSSQLVAVFD